MAEKVGTVNTELLNFSQDPALRRDLRSDYLAVRHKISEEGDELGSLDTKKFDVFIDFMDDLHEKAQLPREQVADAQVLLDITKTVVASVVSCSNGETTPTDFIIGLISRFGQFNKPSGNKDNAHVSLNWSDIGLSVSALQKRALGCSTMLGPMNIEFKRRKALECFTMLGPMNIEFKRRKALECFTMLGPMNIEFKQRKAAVWRTKPTRAQLPKEINNEGGERTATDMNMATIFEILKNKKNVELSSLILNRKSFAQTVLFLAKDGRVRISVEPNGSHIVSPTNGHVANAVAYHHFVFRFDFKDWKLMAEMVAVGEELMPRRNHTNCTPASEEEQAAFTSQTDTAPHTTWMGNPTRNHGLVVQEKPTAEQFFGNDDTAGATALPRCKHNLSFNACVSGSLS